MFGIDSQELLLIVIVAIVVIGPKELPRALYRVGQVMGKIRGFTQHFRTGIDAMVREVELEELEKKWAADNRRIMAEHPEAAALQASEEESADLAFRDGDAPAAAPPTPEAPKLMKLEVPDYVVDVETLDEEFRPPPRPEAAG